MSILLEISKFTISATTKVKIEISQRKRVCFFDTNSPPIERTIPIANAKFKSILPIKIEKTNSGIKPKAGFLKNNNILVAAFILLKQRLVIESV